ncbi:MAG: hypothetical protein GY851_01475 [bacterium]|nr:hypothetical protein [bacterium]
METIAYVLLTIVVVCWLVAMVIGMIAAFPFGLIGLIGLAGFGLLFIKVLSQRLKSSEDDYYSKNVDK